ncbi:hypothetical protein Tco_0545294 [Tanacetum coccineum]
MYGLAIRAHQHQHLVEEVEDGVKGFRRMKKRQKKMADGTTIDGIGNGNWECPKCGNGDFSFRLQNQPRVPVSLLDIAWTLYSVPSIFSVCIDLDRDSNDIRTMAEMSKAVLQAADKGKMTVLQPEIITL